MHVCRCINHFGNNLTDTGFKIVCHFTQGLAFLDLGPAFLFFTLNAHFFHFNGLVTEDFHRPCQITDFTFLIGIQNVDLMIPARQTDHIVGNGKQRDRNTATDHQRNPDHCNQNRRGNTGHHHQAFHKDRVDVIDINAGCNNPSPRLKRLYERKLRTGGIPIGNLVGIVDKALTIFLGNACKLAVMEFARAIFGVNKVFAHKIGFNVMNEYYWRIIEYEEIVGFIVAQCRNGTLGRILRLLFC